MSRERILAHLKDSPELAAQVQLLGRGGRQDARQEKKVEEIAGFAALIIKRLAEWFPEGGRTVLECSCGKSYLGLVLGKLIEKRFPEPFSFVGVDTNARLIEYSRGVAKALGLGNVSFEACRSIQFEPGERQVDVVLGLHACDTATDEAIAKGIKLDARLIMVVPCCQNQIRGQLRRENALETMSQFGPIRFHLANLLTDTLRALYLKAAGYFVEMDEIVSPRVTPKNLCIMARKIKRKSEKDRTVEYRSLRDFFSVKPAIEKLCPEVLERQDSEDS